EKTPSDQLLPLLNNLVKLCNCETKIITKEEFDKAVDVKIDETFNNFLVQYFGEEHSVVKILKLCQQSIIICFLGHFSDIIWNKQKLRIKDCKGEWDIIVKKYENNFSVTHIRSEQVMKMES